MFVVRWVFGYLWFDSWRVSLIGLLDLRLALFVVRR